MSERNKHFINIIFRVIFTSVGAITEIYAISLIFGFRITFPFALATLIIISLIYVWDFFQEYSYEIKRIHRISILTSIILLTFSYLATLLFIDSILSSIFLSILLVMSFFYNSYFKPITKRFPAFKDIFVVFCWNILILVLFLINNISNAGMICLFLLFVLSRDFVNVTYCDLKDISSDKKNKLKTLAAEVGVNGMIKINIFVSLLSVIFLISGYYSGIFPKTILFLIIPVIFTTILILLSHNRRSYSPTNVDFEYIGWLLFTILGKIIL